MTRPGALSQFYTCNLQHPNPKIALKFKSPKPLNSKPFILNLTPQTTPNPKTAKPLNPKPILA